MATIWDNTINSIVNGIKNLINNHNSSSDSHSDIRNNIINYGEVDSTSTSTNFTATVPNLNTLSDGATVMLRNGVVTSESGFTLNVNGLGAKPVYTNLASETRDTTIFNVNYTMLFVFDSDRISGGCWICYRGYDSNTNTIGYQVRTNSTKYIATDKGYRYRLWLQTSEDGKFMPVNTSTSTNATANRSTAMNNREFIIGGDIRYYSTDGTTNQNAEMTATTMWQQYALTLGYSFNNTGSALSLTIGKPVYMVATPTSNGKARLTSPYYTQTLPSSDDGKIYILLGYMYSATSMELTLDHPVFEYRNNSVGLYNPSYSIDEMDYLLDEKADTEHTHTKSEITDFPTIPSKTSDLTNDSGYLTEHNPIDSRLSSTSTNAVQNKVVQENFNGLSNGFTQAIGGVYTQLSTKIDTAGTGLTKTGTTLNHSNSVTAQTSTVLKKISYDGQGHITGTANVTASDIPTLTKSKISDFSHTHNTGEVSDTSAYTNIGSSANATQKTINNYINTRLGEKANTNNVYGKSETYTQGEITTLISNSISNLQLFEVVTSLPTTDIKNNRLYLILNDKSISENKYDIYLYVNNNWEQLDSLEFDISNYYNKTETDTLLEGKVDTSDSRLTDSRTPKSHSHGDITNTGTIGTEENKPLITTTNGKITTGSFGTSQNTFCQGNDSRLSDARQPLSHTHTKSEITDFTHTHSEYVNPTIVDNLTSTDNSKVLSAKQGKVLNDKFTDYLTISNASSTYVSKDGSKVLSTNDFTNNYKMILDNLSPSKMLLESDKGVRIIDYDTDSNDNVYLLNSKLVYDYENDMLTNENGDRLATTYDLNSKADTGHTHGNISNGGKVTIVKTISSSSNVGNDYFIIRDTNDSDATKSANVLDVLNKIVLDLIDEGE